MRILNDKDIAQKIVRLSYEIIEQNIDEKKVILAGINNNGLRFAKLLLQSLNKIDSHYIDFELCRLKLNPAAPLNEDITVDVDSQLLKKSTVILVDDVANTGRTLFYAFKPLMETLTKRIRVAVLVDRKHKSFPIRVDYVGLSLATTVDENIVVNLKSEGNFTVDIA